MARHGRCEALLLCVVLVGCQSQEAELLRVELASCESRVGSGDEEVRRCEEEQGRLRTRLEQAISELPDDEVIEPPPPPPVGQDGSTTLVPAATPSPEDIDVLLERYSTRVKLVLEGLEKKTEEIRTECRGARVAVSQSVQGTQEVAASVAKVNEAVESGLTQLDQCSQRLQDVHGTNEELQSLVRTVRDSLAQFDQQRLVCENCKGSLDLRDWKQREILGFHEQLDRDLKDLEVRLGQ